MRASFAIGVGIWFAAVAWLQPQQTLGAPTRLPDGEILVTKAVTAVSPIRMDLYALQPDGSHLRLLTRNAADAAASRNGGKIAFVRDGAIWVMDRNGSQQTQVTTPPHGVKDDYPAWAPDAGRLYFSHATGSDASESSTASIFSIHPDGSGLDRLTHASASSGLHHLPACDVMPSVSPDGRLVVYTRIGSCSHTADWSLAAATIEGRSTHFKPTWPTWAFEPEFTAGTWAPKQMEIAYSVWDLGDARTAIYISDASGKRARPVVSWALSDSAPWPTDLSPSWSADARWLTFIRPSALIGRPGYGETYAPSSRGDVWVVGTNGVGLRPLTTTGNYTAAAWLPPLPGGSP